MQATHDRATEARHERGASLPLRHAILFAEHQNDGSGEEKDDLEGVGVSLGSLAEAKPKNSRPKRSPTSDKTGQFTY